MPKERLTPVELSDDQEGPLAEARAIADAIETMCSAGLVALDDTIPVLARMLSERLKVVQGALQGA